MPRNKNSKPKCIGVILDGNRRWAKNNGKSSLEGHKAGFNKIPKLLEWANEEGIKHVVVYAFSTENWNRSKEEVNYLMDLFRVYIKDRIEGADKERVKVKFAGQVERLPKDLQGYITKLEEKTKKFKDRSMTVALSYGGRAEIISAIKKLKPSEIKKMTEKKFEKYLWTGNIPDPDIVIRTSGEMRLSNFLTWKSVYSELFFIQKHWPAFSKNDFKKIIRQYSNRGRRMGK